MLSISYQNSPLSRGISVIPTTKMPPPAISYFIPCDFADV